MWENRVDPSTVEPLAVGFLRATQLSEMSGGSSGRGSLTTE